MVSTPIPASTLHDLDFLLNTPSPSSGGRIIEDSYLRIPLKKLQTFVLVSSRRNLDNPNQLPSSLLHRIEETVHRLAEEFHPDGEQRPDTSVFTEFEREFLSLLDEIDEWYFNLRDSLRLQLLSGSLVTIDDISKLISSILELLEVYLDRKGSEDVLEPVILLQTLICFVHKPTPQLLGLAKNVVIHLYLCFMCRRALEEPSGEETFAKRWLDDLLLHWVQTIEPSNPQVSEIYTEALRSSKLSTQLLDDVAFNIAANNFLDSLIHNVWDLLRINSVSLLYVKDKVVEFYRKLRSLRTILKQQHNIAQDDIVFLLHDAGVLIFSLYQTHTELDLRCFHDLLETFKTVLLRLGLKDPPVPEFNFPKTNQLGYVDFVLEKLADLRNREVEPTADSKHVQTIHEELVSLRSFLGDIAELHQEHEELQALWNRVLEVTHKVECLIDHLLVGNLPISSSTSAYAITKDIRDININKTAIRVKRPEIEGKRQQITVKEATLPSSLEINNEVVGFVGDAKVIEDRLKRGPKQLKVIAIVGMPGVGKTTLATKVFNDYSISHHFHVRACCPISQVLDKRNVLSQLLKQVDPNSGCSELNEQDLVESLWRGLKRKRYLILLDDIWAAEAWNSLAPAFPDDNYGSRILLTSRHRDIAPSDMLDQEPHFLQPLNENECLELFQRKFFPGRNDTLDPALRDLFMQFVAYCKGLPLSIILIAGIFATNQPEDWVNIWEELRSGDASVTEHCMDSLGLSYKYLPDHLKPCLLYFGAFPEDAEIPAEKLLCIWIAEGFVRETDGKRIKDVAEEYLNSLIGRSLIMVAKRRWNGRVKTCRIHDLIHDYCLQKAKDDHFLHLLKGYDELSAFNEPHNLRRLCIHSEVKHFKHSKLFCPGARSLLFQDPHTLSRLIRDASFVVSIFKLLRVLDLEGIDLYSEFPSEISLLVQLAFLAIQGYFRNIPSSIAKLTNLETLILKIAQNATSLPDSLWNLQKLKYICIRYCGGIVPIANLDNSLFWYELDVFSGAVIPYSSLERIMAKFPNIRKLKCEIAFSFPENLKELKLGSFDLSWENMSGIGKLPNLQVFKLWWTNLEGETWEMKEGEFSQLRVLKLVRVKLVRWRAGDDQFECLQKLVLNVCKNLEEIPCNCLENIPTLEKIAVLNASWAVNESVKQIEKQQVEQWGNSNLKISVDYSRWAS
ncbi:OLC1v1014039C1 [Oldenlandia corymbosa var. corymbosa]|uniref:OLC1v1014039C1 n=1 Tax=Oldenlandia corymbosa var. corymbosa TaxID=529605 RepID=A0AAV1DZR5_OLDCO|nr:OLC1v1014039C1 [Oldenlandia corymbosa var. corymbosa]